MLLINGDIFNKLLNNESLCSDNNNILLLNFSFISFSFKFNNLFLSFNSFINLNISKISSSLELPVCERINENYSFLKFGIEIINSNEEVLLLIDYIFYISFN